MPAIFHCQGKTLKASDTRNKSGVNYRVVDYRRRK